MADTKLTDLGDFTPVLTDVLYGVDDPGSAKTPGKHTYAVLATLLEANFVNLTATNLTLGGDVVLERDGAAETLALRNSTNAQIFHVYNTFTDSDNYERGMFAWDTNVLEIGTKNAGTGSQRSVSLQRGGLEHILLAGTVQLKKNTLLAANTYLELQIMNSAPPVGAVGRGQFFTIANAGLDIMAGVKFQDGLPLYFATEGTLGTVGTGTTAEEHGDGYNMVTVLTMAGVLPDIPAGGAAFATGLLIYTFPAGVTRVKSVHMDVGITQSEGNIDADQPFVGIGSDQATGAVSVLNGTTEFDDYVTEKAAANCTGTTTDFSFDTVDAGLTLNIAGGDKTVWFNAADAWNTGGDDAATLSGTVTIEWTFLGS